MKTYRGIYRNKLGQSNHVNVIRGSREFKLEGGLSGNTVKIMFDADPRHVYTVWEHQII